MIKKQSNTKETWALIIDALEKFKMTGDVSSISNLVSDAPTGFPQKLTHEDYDSPQIRDGNFVASCVEDIIGDLQVASLVCLIDKELPNVARYLQLSMIEVSDRFNLVILETLIELFAILRVKPDFQLIGIEVARADFPYLELREILQEKVDNMLRTQ